MSEREVSVSMSTVRWLVGGFVALCAANMNLVWALYAENQELKLQLLVVEVTLGEDATKAEDATLEKKLEALR